MYLLIAYAPSHYHVENLEISENRIFFKHTQHRLLHIIFS